MRYDSIKSFLKSNSIKQVKVLSLVLVIIGGQNI